MERAFSVAAQPFLASGDFPPSNKVLAAFWRSVGPRDRALGRDKKNLTGDEHLLLHGVDGQSIEEE